MNCVWFIATMKHAQGGDRKASLCVTDHLTNKNRFFEILNRATINKGRGAFGKSTKLCPFVWPGSLFNWNGSWEQEKLLLVWEISRSKSDYTALPDALFLFGFIICGYRRPWQPDEGVHMAAWRRGARDSPEGAEETRQRLSQQALNLTDPQWSNGRSPTGNDPLYTFQTKAWSMETNIICPLTHPPASWFTWLLSEVNRCPGMFFECDRSVSLLTHHLPSWRLV